MGDITLEFMPDKAPNHVRNFLRLAQAGVYDGMAFHRVAKGFVIQTGLSAVAKRAAVGERSSVSCATSSRSSTTRRT